MSSVDLHCLPRSLQNSVGALAPMEVLQLVFRLALPRYFDGALLFCVARGTLASVCRYWAAIVYGDSSLWSSLSVTRRLSMDSLRLAVALARGRTLRVKLSFKSFPEAVSSTCAAPLIDTIFSILSPTSPRWSSFVLSCQHPVVFDLVNRHCADLYSPLLESISVLYWYFPGHGPLRPDQSYLAPLPWFRGSTPVLSRLELNGVPLVWSTPLLFDRLVSLVLCDFPRMASFGWQFFSTLFGSAQHLRTLSMGNIYLQPAFPTAVLLCRSLEELDVRFLASMDLGHLLQCMDVPGLKVFTVRAFYQLDLEITLSCRHILSRVVRFNLHGWMGQSKSLWPLFEQLSAAQILDLTHAREVSFRSFMTGPLLAGKVGRSVE
ncbi:hypothetical protein C8R44DRAFT_888663 [Mycena epipterygia]|nr:hypothetical protein C8R44DRAFT_888663 [Mycena epipterygia]